MTKIYEALELAKQTVIEEEKEPVSLRPVEDALRPFDIKMEETLIGLYHNVATLLPKTKGKIIQFIASRKGDGTSILIRELAKTAASRLNNSVLLLDTDQYDPSQASSFAITPKFGWENVIGNERTFNNALYRVGKSRLFVSQVFLSGSSEPLVFESPEFEDALNKLRENFDLILVDSPPAIQYPDGVVLSRKMDGVVLVVEAEKTRWQVARSVRDRILMQGGKILGVILNKRRYHIPKKIYELL